MKKVLLLSMLFTLATMMGKAQVVFDPSTYGGVLPANMEIVNIDGTDYLQVVTDGWDNIVDLDPVIITNAKQFSMMAKLAIAGSDTLSLSEVNTFLKLTSAFADTVEIGAAGSGSSETFQLYTVNIAVQDTINILQVAAQQTISWGATTGDTLWIGKVEVTPAPTNDFAVEYPLDAPNIADTSDYKVDMNLSWTDTTIVIKLNVNDDVIYNDGGNLYSQDNIEIYIDMDNSKSATLDTNDYQFRVANDSAWETATPGQNADVGGVIFEYMIDTLATGDTVGYMYSVTIPWDSMLVGYTPQIGAQIGFDIDASDNDGDPVYRDQVTWNAQNTNLWQNPYYWGVLVLSENGKFLALADEENPSVPANLAAEVEGSTVHLTWDASTDNRHVGGYIISQDGDEIDTVSSTSKNVSDLAAGTYTFTVRAVDIYGNESANAAGVDAIVEDVEPAVKETMVNFNSIYPNPTDGMVNIVSESTSPVTIEVYTANGSMVVTDTFQNDYTLDLSGVSKGMYFIKLKTDNKVQIEKLVVK